jgi:hypothetical protein
MAMDAELAKIYGTFGQEKTAADELEENLATETEEAGAYSDDELELMAQAALGAETEEAGQEKLSEDDMAKAGRVMAHAFVAEMQEINKVAAANDGGIHPPSRMDKAKGWMKSKGKAFGEKSKEMGGTAKGFAGKAGAHIKAHPKSYGAGAAGLAAAGGGLAALLHKKKESADTTALDMLINARIDEILTEGGHDPAAVAAFFASPEGQEKLSAAQKPSYDPNALAQTVEERAIAALEEMGFQFEAPAAE